MPHDKTPRDERHRAAATAILERIKVARAMVLSPLAVDALTEALAQTEAAALERGRREGSEPFELLAGSLLEVSMLSARNGHGHRIYNKHGPEQGEGATWTEAARNLCVRLGLLKGDADG